MPMLAISDLAAQALIQPLRYIKARIEFAWDGQNYLDMTPYVVSYTTSEELGNSKSMSFGAVNMNELIIVLDNADKRFSITNKQSPHYNDLRSLVPVRLTYLVEISPDVFESVPGGVYYTDTWKADNAAITASVTCYDALQKVLSTEIINKSAAYELQYTEAVNYICDCLQITQQKLVDNLGMKVPVMYLNSDKKLTALKDFATTYGINIWMDRFERIRFEDAFKKSTTPDFTIADSTLIKSSKIVPSYSNLYSTLEVSYNEFIADAVKEVLNVENLPVPKGVTTFSKLQASEVPLTGIRAIQLNTPVGVSLTEFSYSDSAINMQLNNTQPYGSFVNVKISGCLPSSVSRVDTFKNPESKYQNPMQLTLPMITSSEAANRIGNGILDVNDNLLGIIELEIRGLPHIEPGDIIRLDSPSCRASGLFKLLSVKNTYNMGLYATIKLLKVGE